jgi:hypothetical protein
VKTYSEIPRRSLTKEQLCIFFGDSYKLVDRMLWASRYTDDPWLELTSNKEGSPGKNIRVTTESAEKAHERLRRGEEPPLMPSERKRHRKLRRLVRNSEDLDVTIGNLLEMARALPPRVSSVTLNPLKRSIVLHFPKGAGQYCRMALAKPTQQRRILTVTFAKNASTPGPLDNMPLPLEEDGDC